MVCLTKPLLSCSQPHLLVADPVVTDEALAITLPLKHFLIHAQFSFYKKQPYVTVLFNSLCIRNKVLPHLLCTILS
jgi:hypothetical protein